MRRLFRRAETVGATRMLLPPAVVLCAFLFTAAAADGQALAVSFRPAAVGFASPSTIIQAAKTFLGVPYVHGGDSRLGLDCSGLVYRVFHDILGLDLPRGVPALYHAGQAEGPRLHVGDLLFFDTDDVAGRSTPTHVGVYSGGGRFVHAASEGAKTGVTVSSLASPYYSERFLGARRVFPWRQPVLAVTVKDDPESVSDPNPFPSNEPLQIDIYNGMSGGGPLDIAVLKDGTQVLSRRIVPGGRTPAHVEIIPDVGTWTVRINRIFKGRQLALVGFTVEE